MNVSEYEYRRLKEIERRYNEVIDFSLTTARVDKEHQGELFITGGGVRRIIRLYHADKYEKRKKEIYGSMDI